MGGCQLRWGIGLGHRNPVCEEYRGMLSQTWCVYLLMLVTKPVISRCVLFLNHQE